MKHITILLIVILLACVHFTSIHSQNGIIPCGATISKDGLEASFTIGRFGSFSHSGTPTRIVGGLQRGIGKILIKSDNFFCSGDSLLKMEGNVSGGEWSVKTKIGTTIDSIGYLSLGINPSVLPANDTVYFSFNGYFDSITLEILKLGTPLNCQDLSLITDSNGKIYLDQPAIGIATQGALNSQSTYLLSDSVFQCTSGFEQSLNIKIRDTSVCKTCDIFVTLVDTIQPVAGCKATDELVLLWSGTTLTPASYKGSSSDNCGASGLDFSFSDDFTQPSLVLTCKEQLQLNDTVTLYIKDQSNNISTCNISLSYDEGKGEDCSCDWGGLKLKGEINPNDYKAREYIIASGSITLGDTVNMKAGNIIIFSPGFQVSKGSSLFVKIDTCGDYQPATSLSALTTNKASMDDLNLRGAEYNDLNLGDVQYFQAYPNPFIGWFKVSFALESAGILNLDLYNTQGGQVYSLMSDVVYESGTHEIMIDGSRISKGMYVLRMEKEGLSYTLPLVKMD